MKKVVKRRLTRQESQALTRDRLLNSARDLFRERGIEATSIEQVTEMAGYSRGAFHSNFENKDALVCAVLNRELAKSEEDLAEIIVKAPPAKLLESIRDFYVRFASDVNGCALLVTMQMYALQNAAIRRRIAESFQTDRKAKVKLVRRAELELRKSGIRLPSSPETLCLALTSQAQGLCISWMVDQENVGLAKIQRLLRLSFDSMTGCPNRQTRGKTT